MSPLTIGQYSTHDFSLRGNAGSGNPFMAVLHADFVHESGARINGVPGFYAGDGVWKIRFSPDRQGLWKGTVRSDNAQFDTIRLDELVCVAGRGHGVIRIDPENPRRFAWDDGTAFVPLGFECDWLFSYHKRHPRECRRHCERIAARGFNYIVTNVYAHVGFSMVRDDMEAWIKNCSNNAPQADLQYIYGPPDLYVFGGTNDAPDHSRLNTGFFDDFDSLMSMLRELGIVAHLMIQVQNKQVRWPERFSAEDDLYWKYVTARYQAFGNVVWDVGKESYILLRETGSHRYTLDRIALIRKNDAYRHLVTVHDPERDAAHNPHDSEVDRECDFISDQIHLGDVTAYNHEAIRRQRTYSKPYMNIEYGYETGAERLMTFKGGTTAPWQDVLAWTWAIAAAGAYPCYYYDNTAWDLVKFEPEPEGWRRYRLMRDILDSIPFNRMAADNELVDSGFCLAEEGKVYLVYLPYGGDVVLDCSVFPWGTRLSAEWMDIHSGARKTAHAETRGFRTRLANQLEAAGPCVVVVKKT